MDVSQVEFVLIIFLAYWGAVEYLKKKGVLERIGITAYGPILMIRTKKGLNFLKKLAEFNKLWIFLGTAGIPAVFAGMIFMLILILFMDYSLFTAPPPPSDLTSPRNVFLIPGVNKFIPLVWGLVGLIVTLIVHEFSHAISALSENIRVKSIGVILALVPIGGFAEPDEEQLLHKSERATRLRVFSSGVISNFITAGITLSLFIYLVGFLSPSIAILHSENPDLKAGDIIVEVNGQKVHSIKDVSEAVGDAGTITLMLKDGRTVTIEEPTGVKIARVVEGYPAEFAGLKEGEIITAVNGVKIHTLQDFLEVMKDKKGGDAVKLRVFDGKEYREVELTLRDENGRGLIGVQVVEYFGGVVFSHYYAENILETFKKLPSMLKSIEGWLFLISMPIIYFNSFSPPLTSFFSNPFGDWFYYILNTLYWVGWLNFYVGLFNCLPALPLDGGRIYYDVAEKIGGKRLAEVGTRFLTVLIFGSIILSIVIPNLPR